MFPSWKCVAIVVFVSVAVVSARVASPCMTVRCSAGYHCEVVPNQCVRAPCTGSTAQCVPDQKQTVCPMYKCTQNCATYMKDADGCNTCDCETTGTGCEEPICTAVVCEYGNVYDANNCKTCECKPAPTGVQCGNTQCTSNQVCQERDPPVMQCFAAPCDLVCVDKA
jgi:hypothetical protein